MMERYEMSVTAVRQLGEDPYRVREDGRRWQIVADGYPVKSSWATREEAESEAAAFNALRVRRIERAQAANDESK